MNIRHPREEQRARLDKSEAGLDSALEAMKKFYLDATRTLLTRSERVELESFFRTVSIEALGLPSNDATAPVERTRAR